MDSLTVRAAKQRTINTMSHGALSTPHSLIGAQRYLFFMEIRHLATSSNIAFKHL